MNLLRTLRRTPASRLETIAWSVGLLALVVGFGWFSVKSYNFVHGGITGLSGDRLKPVATAGPEQTVFRWAKQACEPRDIPDLPARAYRDFQGRVHLFTASYIGYAMVGPSLDAVEPDCRVVFRSDLSAAPQQFADREWIAAPYTNDGQNVFALVHDEYHGWQHATGRCLTGFPRCWYNAVTLARSADGGLTFQPALPPPANLVAAVPYAYVPDQRPYGVFNPSNIVKKGKYYYALVVTQAHRAQRPGTCVIRTSNLADPRSWRAWDGDGYNVTFADPYRVRDAAAGDHFCEPVSYDQIGTMSDSLTYNTYFGKYLLVGSNSAYDTRHRRTVYGFYYSLSDDLVDWSQRKLLRPGGLTFSYKCGDPDPILYPSLLDPATPSRNFETTGRRPYLYFTRFHYSGCRSTLNRDLVRVRLQFSK